MVSEEEKRFNALCFKVFTTEDGKSLLKELHNTMLIAPVARPDKEIYFAYWREGQNDMIRRFRTAMKHHSETIRGDHD